MNNNNFQILLVIIFYIFHHDIQTGLNQILIVSENPTLFFIPSHYLKNFINKDQKMSNVIVDLICQYFDSLHITHCLTMMKWTQEVDNKFLLSCKKYMVFRSKSFNVMQFSYYGTIVAITLQYLLKNPDFHNNFLAKAEKIKSINKILIENLKKNFRNDDNFFLYQEIFIMEHNLFICIEYSKCCIFMHYSDEGQINGIQILDLRFLKEKDLTCYADEIFIGQELIIFRCNFLRNTGRGIFFLQGRLPTFKNLEELNEFTWSLQKLLSDSQKDCLSGSQFSQDGCLRLTDEKNDFKNNLMRKGKNFIKYFMNGDSTFLNLIITGLAYLLLIKIVFQI